MILCKCGCGQEIVIKSHHKYYGIPEYIRGHDLKNRVKRISIFSPPIFCQCGCGHEIIWKEHYRWRKSIPRYICGHHNNLKLYKNKISEANKGRSPPNKNPYPPIFDICHCGCGEIVWGGQLWIIGHNSKVGVWNKGMKMPVEVGEKISQSNKGRNVWNKGMKECYSKETIEKMSDAKIGHIPWNKGLSENLQPRWKGGISKFPYCEKWTPKLREIIRELYNRKCFVCSKDEKNNFTKNNKHKKLSIHHVNYDKEQGCNGKNWILVSLCITHHNQTSGGNRDYWQEYFTDLLHERFKLNRHFEGDLQ